MKNNFRLITIIFFFTLISTSSIAQNSGKGNANISNVSVKGDLITITTPQGNVNISKVYNNTTKVYEWKLSDKDAEKLSDKVVEDLMVTLQGEIDKFKIDIHEIKSILLAEQNGKIQMKDDYIKVLKDSILTLQSKVIDMNDANTGLLHRKNYVELKSAGIAVQTNDISEEALDFGSMKKLCENSIRSGFTDWRVPTIDELATIFENKELVGNLKSEYYWSLQSKKDHYHYILEMKNGKIIQKEYNSISGSSYRNEYNAYSYYCRCVRTIKKETRKK